MNYSHDHPDGDPLEGADVGDTETVTVTRELWVGELEADACRGSDRLADSEVIDTAVVTDERGDEHLAVTVESDVTKRLPRNWDTCREPRTEAEASQARRDRWKRRTNAAFPLVFALGVSVFIATRIMNETSGEVTVDGDPLLAPTFAKLALPVGVIVLLVIFARWAVSGGIPPHYGGGRR